MQEISGWVYTMKTISESTSSLMCPSKQNFGCLLLYFPDESKCDGRLGESLVICRCSNGRFPAIPFWVNLIFTYFYCAGFLPISTNCSPPTCVHIVNIFSIVQNGTSSYCKHIFLLVLWERNYTITLSFIL